MNRLTLAHVRVPSSRGTDHYLDWVIDGIPLRERIRVAEDDANANTMTTVINDAFVASSAIQNVDALSGVGPADFADGRVALLVCEECGDVGCGAYSTRVEVGENLVRWASIGYQNDYEPFTSEDDTGLVFEFERRFYEALLAGLRQMLDARPTGDPLARVHISDPFST